MNIKQIPQQDQTSFAGTLRCLNPLMPVGNYSLYISQSTIDSEGFKGGTRGAPIMPTDAVSRTANEKLVTIVANRH